MLNASLDSGGETSLFRVALRGDLRATQRLLAAGADPNQICVGGFTAVHAACRSGSAEVLGALLEHGGDLEIHDCWRQTPVDWIYDQPDSDKRDEVLGLIDCVRRWSVSEASTTKQSMVYPKYKNTRQSLGFMSQYRYLERAPKQHNEYAPKQHSQHVPKQHDEYVLKQSTFVDSAIGFSKRKTSYVPSSSMDRPLEEHKNARPTLGLMSQFRYFERASKQQSEYAPKKHSQHVLKQSTFADRAFGFPKRKTFEAGSPILRASNQRKATSFDFSTPRRDKVFRFTSMNTPLDEEIGPPDMMSTMTDEWNTVDEAQEGTMSEEWNTVDEAQEGANDQEERYIADEGAVNKEWNGVDEAQEGTMTDGWNTVDEAQEGDNDQEDRYIVDEGAVNEEWNAVDEAQEGIITDERNTVEEAQEGTMTDEWNTVDEEAQEGANDQEERYIVDEGAVNEEWNAVDEAQEGTIPDDRNTVEEVQEGTVTDEWNTVDES